MCFPCLLLVKSVDLKAIHNVVPFEAAEGSRRSSRCSCIHQSRETRSRAGRSTVRCPRPGPAGCQAAAAPGRSCGAGPAGAGGSPAAPGRSGAPGSCVSPGVLGCNRTARFEPRLPPPGRGLPALGAAARGPPPAAGPGSSPAVVPLPARWRHAIARGALAAAVTPALTAAAAAFAREPQSRSRRAEGSGGLRRAGRPSGGSARPCSFLPAALKRARLLLITAAVPSAAAAQLTGCKPRHPSGAAPAPAG